jgi:hypothetical protein
MLDPDIIAKSVVAYWHRGPYPLHTFDENDPDTATEIADIAAALRAYGEACAAWERENLLRVALMTVVEIKNTTTVNPSALGYNGGKRVGAADVYSALVNSPPPEAAPGRRSASSHP